MKKIYLFLVVLLANNSNLISQNDIYRRIFEIMMNYQKIDLDNGMNQKVYTTDQPGVEGQLKAKTTISVYSKDGQKRKIKEENLIGDNVTQRIYYFMDDQLTSVKELIGKVQDSIATFNYGEPLVNESAEYFFHDGKLYESRLFPAEEGSVFDNKFNPFKKEEELLSALKNVMLQIDSKK